MMSTHNANRLILLTIFGLAFALRFVGLNWDNNAHLHPDERFLTMVAGNMTWTKTMTDYFDTKRSTLNPHNIGYNFYVYGTFPVLLVKYLAGLISLDNYNGLTLVGRFVSGLFDLGSVVVVYLFVRSLKTTFMMATTVLGIQLSHFFAVDTFLVFFITLTFLLLIRKKHPILTGLVFGLAIACKITALFFLPFIGIYYFFKKKWLQGVIFLIFAAISTRIFLPYLFDGVVSLNPKVIANWKELKSYDDPSGWFPPATMWINAQKYIFPANNLFFYGLGIFASLLLGVGLVLVIKNIKNNPLETNIFLAMVILFFIYQGGSFVKALRYFYPIIPFLIILSTRLIERIRFIYLLPLLVWPLMFISIYTRPNTRIIASEWIYKNIPIGSKIAWELWDDPLPLCLPNKPCGAYPGIDLSIYGPDTLEKWQVIKSKLTEADYLVLSSSRLYGSISSVPEKYPIASIYYKELFAGETEFKKIAEFTSRPGFFLPKIKLCLKLSLEKYGLVNAPECKQNGIFIVDDYADETFTVYDHPKVSIFVKQKKLPQM